MPLNSSAQVNNQLPPEELAELEEELEELDVEEDELEDELDELVDELDEDELDELVGAPEEPFPELDEQAAVRIQNKGKRWRIMG